MALASTTDPTLLGQYFSLRFQKINYSSATYNIDFKEVQAVLYDQHGHIAAIKSPDPTQPIWDKKRHWIIFKNGEWIMVDPANTTPNVEDAWRNYRNWLQGNPAFISFP